jgi:FkbM family methyltransferase
MNYLVYALLGLYKMAVKTGLLQTRFGQALFTRSYMLYKRLIEARDVKALLHYVPAGSCVIDVGANIGFFTLQFAQRVGHNGRVIALEPEAHNFRQLEQQVRSAGLTARVTLLEAVAAAQAGESHLQLDPYHPANHKISDKGVAVKAVTLNDLALAQPLPVALVKIDVQGAEMQVLDGALELINRQHPALFVEVDNQALQGFGTSAAALMQRLLELGYRIYQLHPKELSAPLTLAQALAHQAAAGYTDFLFLHNDSEVAK